MPNDRSSHTTPTPRGGGVAIVIAWYSGLTIFYLKGNVDSHLYFALLSGILLAIISYIDDIVCLNPLIRLIVQIVTTVLALISLKGIESVVLFDFIKISKIILIPIGFIAVIWFINLYNFLDGIDGYASIEAICLLSGIYLFTGDSLNLILIASIMGFLIWNWPKAKIFMGDVGSTQIGFILVILGIYYHNESELPLWTLLILTSPFWFDATYTLYRRWKNKEKLSQAHRKHIYQRLVQSGFSHLKVDIWLILINSILFIMVYVSAENHVLQFSGLLAAIVLLWSIARYTEKRKPFPLD